MTADAILEAYRNAVATETADACADIARLEDEVRAANGALYAAQNRLAAIVTRHNADLYRDLHVKVDPVTGDAVARQGKPTKAAQAARSASASAECGETPPPPEAPVETGTTAPEDAPPDDDASGLAAAFATANEWASCDAGKARGHAISALGYTANELVGLGDVQIRAICKHRIAPAEFGGVVVGGVMVDGVTWLLEAPARVVAP